MRKFSSEDVQIGGNPEHGSSGIRVIERLGKAEALLAVGDRFRELPEIGASPGQMKASCYGRESGETKPFPAQITVEQLQDFQEKVFGTTIATCRGMSHTEVEIPRDLELSVPKRLAQGLGALAEGERFRRMASHKEVVAHIDGLLTESPSIVERPRKPFGLAKIAGDPVEVTKGK